MKLFSVTVPAGLAGVAGVLVALALSLPISPAAANSTQTSGPSLRTQIIGGTSATAGSFPYLAYIVYHAPGSPMWESCTGSVVASNVILTAGHCARDETTNALLSAANFQVSTGAVDVSSPSGVLTGVKSVVVNPSYDPNTDENDDALLVLSQPVSAPTIRLATPADQALEQRGMGATIAGWGLTVGNGNSTPLNLQWASTVVQSSGYCLQNSSSNFPFNSADELCAIDFPSLTTGICSGDSGGPLVVRDATGAPVEIGVADTSADNCLTTFPSFFARVSAFSTWANGIIQANQPANITGNPGTSTTPAVTTTLPATTTTPTTPPTTTTPTGTTPPPTVTTPPPTVTTTTPTGTTPPPTVTPPPPTVTTTTPTAPTVTTTTPATTSPTSTPPPAPTPTPSTPVTSIPAKPLVATLPTMSLAAGHALAFQTLSHILGKAFERREQTTAKCVSESRTSVGCDIVFRSGAFDYTTVVLVRYTKVVARKTAWSGSALIKWAAEQCLRSSHRARCPVSSKAGNSRG